MPSEPEPFDLCACSCMSYLVGLICARVRIFHSEYQRELPIASSEPSTSRLPEEDSSDMDSDSDDEFHKLTLTVKSLHLSGLRKSAKKAIVCLL